MYKVLLADGTVIENCSESTTSNEIYAVRNSYAEAGAVRDLFTPDNAKVIEVENDLLPPTKIVTGTDLILLPGCSITEGENGTYTVKIQTRVKTETEKMQDEIAELQEVVIEG